MKINILTIVIIILLRTITSATNYSGFTTYLTNNKIPFDRNKKILVILYTKSSCMGCNGILYSVLSNPKVKYNIPTSNIFVVTTPIRPIEFEAIQKQLNISKEIRFIYEHRFYNDFSALLNDKIIKAGGMIFLSKNGSIECLFNFKDVNWENAFKKDYLKKKE